ncbi:MAG: hypothetical protein Unbinned3992contig1000_55 [Prokaryotic dsDNA virus sp.]|nr:MAG: hypothetical protein Unbinned3992contig1000_55 [Prokaryotic dsDNA virus sp.]|tara:strand:- start:16157 stop:17005 length:849 start_codon:yes stop_codon:yes gene_type:complete
MAFLTISGYEIPISSDGVSLERQGYGERTLSYGGAQQPERWGVTNVFDLTATLMTREQARALSGLIQGDGHYWAYDTMLYSSKGLGPVTGYIVTMSATGGAVGGGYVQVTSSHDIEYPFNTSSDRTMMVCKYVGAAWVHYALTYDASTATTVQYKNGAEHTPAGGDNITNWYTYTASTGIHKLDGKDIAGTNADARYDQLVIVPYVMPADMIAAFDTELLTTNLAFSPLPLLRVSGTMIEDGPQLYAGSTVNSSYQIAAVTASDNIGLDLQFTLTEYQARLT